MKSVTKDKVLERVDNLAGTVENLSGKVDKLTDRVDNLTGTVENLSGKFEHLTETVDDLAVMVKHGFDETGKRLDVLESGQMDIKARLDSNVYRFEYHALEKRVETIETQLREPR
jgi:outer membrane murein-binding lipoprotein Lpp